MWKNFYKDKENQERVINEIINYFSKLISKYYRTVYFLANPVLTRDPTESSIIEKIIQTSIGEHVSKFKLNTSDSLSKIIKYYIKSFIHFLFFIIRFFAAKSSNLKHKLQKINPAEDLIVIDTYTMIDKNFPNNRFNDPFFGDLYGALKKRNKQYVILSILFGAKPYNFKKWQHTYNILSNDERTFITEYDLLSLGDYIRILWFIIAYPLITLKLLKVNINELYDDVFKEEVVDTLDRVQFFNYIRYLVGRRLKRLSNKKIKLISWYENQVMNKLLYRGLRDSNADCYIYGCQFFIQFSFWLHIYPLAAEKTHKVTPDEILVAGKYYLNESATFNYKLGVAPRYNYLIPLKYSADDLKERENISVFLTIHIEDSKNIIKTVLDSGIDKGNTVYIKFHPNHVVENPGYIFPETWIFTTERLDNLCKESKIIISAGSGGTILEAASMGCSVIAIGNKNALTFNSMPDLGKGEIWDVAFDADELIDAYKRLSAFRDENIERIAELSEKYKEMFFNEATEEKFIEIFDL